jgi:hypothetical protein
VPGLQEICGSLGPGHIEALLRKRLRILSNPFTVTDEDVTAGYRYELSILQAEFCLTLAAIRSASSSVSWSPSARVIESSSPTSVSVRTSSVSTPTAHPR